MGGGNAGAESQRAATHCPSVTYPAVPCNSGDADGGTETNMRVSKAFSKEEEDEASAATTYPMFTNLYTAYH